MRWRVWGGPLCCRRNRLKFEIGMPKATGGSTAPITMDAVEAPLVPGRECGSCTLCCKVYHVAEIDKVAGKWCQHCKPGSGCAIHDSLPKQCAEFNCLWRTEE